MTISWPLSRQQVLDASGRPLLVPRAFFFAAGTTTPLTVYSDAALSVPLTQPVVADGFGRFPRVYLPEVLYREEVVGPYGDLLWNDDGLGEAPAVDTTDPTVPVDPTAAATTGDVKWRLDAGILPGWVRMNGRTLGAANSGATELAGASALSLYVYLWQTFPDTIAGVVSGRGMTAAADFSAGKPITIPTMQGLIAGGLDDMGSTAAGRLQTIVNVTLTAGSATATVASAARLALGMTLVADGVSTGTTIVAISGTTITLSQAAATGSTGTVSGRFSLLGDAQVPGQVAGDSIEGLSNANLPSVLPSGVVTVGDPGVTYQSFIDLTGASQGAGGTPISGLWHGAKDVTVPATSTNYSVANANPGGGVPISTLQPTRLGTFFLKL